MTDVVKERVEVELESEGSSNKKTTAHLSLTALKRYVWWEAVRMSIEAREARNNTSVTSL
jgi:hypothetical protein